MLLWNTSKNFIKVFISGEKNGKWEKLTNISKGNNSGNFISKCLWQVMNPSTSSKNGMYTHKYKSTALQVASRQWWVPSKHFFYKYSHLRVTMDPNKNIYVKFSNVQHYCDKEPQPTARKTRKWFIAEVVRVNGYHNTLDNEDRCSFNSDANIWKK
jgi:hypothetical protein